MASSRSKDAIYSGYLMSVDDFKQLFSSLKTEYANELLFNHIHGYDAWRRRLPKADRAKVPKLSIGEDDCPSEETVEKVFFPVRYVRYTGEKQLLPNEENKHLWEENEADKAMLDEFVRFVASQGGRLDFSSVAGFGCLKDRHPGYAWGHW